MRTKVYYAASAIFIIALISWGYLLYNPTFSTGYSDDVGNYSASDLTKQQYSAYISSLSGEYKREAIAQTEVTYFNYLPEYTSTILFCIMILTLALAFVAFYSKNKHRNQERAIAT